jgi:hypothetical protein
MAKRDPRRIITPDVFTVSPELVGIALARPSRRLFAIALDGLCIAVLSRVGGKMLLALAAALMLWRAGNKSNAQQGDDRSVMRFFLRFASVFAVFLFAIAAWKFVARHTPHSDRNAASGKATGKSNSIFSIDSPNGKVDLGDLGLTLSDAPMLRVVGGLSDADDSAAAAASADSIAQWIRTKPDSSRRRIAQLLDDGFRDEPAGAALQASLREYLPPAPADRMARRVLQLRRENNALKKSNADLKKENEAEQGFTMSKLLKSLSDLLGFGFGWGAVYFATFTTLMRGQTPGKKLLGIRVIRLDGEALTGWMSFERFGGYAASAATGLLGFAQILWDRNRQALHDKVAETVVIRVVNGEPVRPPEAVAYAAAARRGMSGGA